MANQIDRDAFVKRNVLKNPIHYVRGTDMLPIVIHFRDFQIQSGATARVFVSKPDGKAVYTTATIEGNDVTIDVTEQMFITLGMSFIQISIMDGDEELVSFAQPVMVENNLKAGDFPKSITDVSFLDDVIAQADQAVSNANTAVQNANQAIEDANDAISELNTQIASLNTNFASLANSVNIAQLQTTAKTLVGGINELNSKTIFADNAGFHNSVYRGKNLGTSFTEAMSSAIQNGTFDDLFVGDYLTINGTVYRIAGFNLIKNCGDNITIGNNMCLVPDNALYNAKMNSTDTTEGAYANSEMRTTNLAQATTKITTDFGSSHVISYRDILTNATSSGQASRWEWYDCKVELMSEVMVCGTKIWGNRGYEVGCLNEQFPLFRLDPESIHRRLNYWLRSVGSAAGFAFVSIYGGADNGDAQYDFGVRPFFFVN